MLTRRKFLGQCATASALAALVPGCYTARRDSQGVWVNDIHSRLNRTHVLRIEQPARLGELQDAVHRARQEGRALSMTGGRHAMGGQQFGSDTVLLDTGLLAGISDFDADNGSVEVGAGTQWPQLVTELAAL
jgi:FAD/FMN-containing dehydrogenase